MLPKLSCRGFSLVALPLLALTAACGGRPSKKAIKEMIASSSKFQAPLTVYVPQRITLIPQVVALPNGGESVSSYNPDSRSLRMDANNVGRLSAPLAVLWAAGVVDVSDAASVRTLTTKPATPAVETVDEDGTSRVVERAHSASTFDAYGHVLTVTRREDAAANGPEWKKDDEGPANPPNAWYRQATTPGWVLTVAHRRFVRIDTILDETSINEHVDPGELLVQFTYAWDPTQPGEAFVPGTDAYDELPESVKYIEPFSGGPLRSREQAAHLVLRRSGMGWAIARIGRDWRDAGGVNGPM
jgi:hypothetical protein